MKSFFKELFDYDQHSNIKIAESFLTNLNVVSDESVKIFCHILNAHEIWNSRILGSKSKFGIWDPHNPMDFKKIITANRVNTGSLIERVSLDENIRYSNDKRKKIREILFHIINHSTYHRGQIAMDFRKHGIEPIATDYIHYHKNR